MSSTFWDVRELLNRGWSERMVRRLLGAPCRWEAVNHWANSTGKKMYSAERVEAVESTPAFKSALAKAQLRRGIISEGRSPNHREDSTPSPSPKSGHKSRPLNPTIEKAALKIEEARIRGYRTPHRS